MDFYDVVGRVLELLERQKRVSYRALKRQFSLDDDYIEDLKDELIYAKQVARDEDNRVLVWSGASESTPVLVNPPDQPESPPRVPPAEPVQQPTSPVASHTPAAERRQLTVMFCDLVGSTELSGRFDPEDYRELVRTYQTTCGEVIERFGCHNPQSWGDGLLIYSGYPVAHENDAERAVRVGLGILDAMKTLNVRLERDTDVRLAVQQF